MPSHTYRFIKIQDHLPVNVTNWRMVITEHDPKCQRLKESVLQDKIKNTVKTIMLLTLGLLNAVA